MNSKHAPNTWRQSSCADAVVSDEPTGCDSPDNVEHYGGHLVAESIFSGSNRALIIAAPDLLQAAQQAADTLNGTHGKQVRLRVRDALLQAIAKATGAAA